MMVVSRRKRLPTNGSTISSRPSRISLLFFVSISVYLSLCSDGSKLIVSDEQHKATSLFAQGASTGSSVPWHSSQAYLSKKDWDNMKTYVQLPPTVFAPQGRLYIVEEIMKVISSPEDPSSNLVIALHCKDGVVVVTTVTGPAQASFLQTEINLLLDSNKISTTSSDDDTANKSPLWLDYANNNNKMENQEADGPRFPSGSRFVNTPFSDNEQIWAVTAGNAVHSQIFRRKIQSVADSIWESHDDGIVTIAGMQQKTTKLLGPSPSAALLARKLADYCQIPTQTIGSKAGRILVVSTVE